MVVAVVAATLFWLRPWLLAIGNANLIGLFRRAGWRVRDGRGADRVLLRHGHLRLPGAHHAYPAPIVVSRMDEGMSSLVLLAVPMFVFLGLLMEATGLARVLVDFLAALCGHLRGGLSFVLLGAMFLVSGISGAKAADMAAVAPFCSGNAASRCG